MSKKDSSKSILWQKRVTLGVGALTLGAAGGLFFNSSRQTPDYLLDIPAVRSTDTGLDPRTAPIFERDSAKPFEPPDIKISRAVIPPDTLVTAIGRYLDLDIETPYCFECELQKDKVFLNAIHKVDVPERRKESFTPVISDPIYMLDDSVTADQFKQLFDQYRTGIRCNADIPLIDELPFHSLETTIAAREREYESPVSAIASMRPNERLFIRLHVGAVDSPQYKWLKQIGEQAEEIVRAIDNEYLSRDPFAVFLKYVVADQDRSGFDINAHEVLLRVFSLTDEDRKLFANALQKNDLRTATDIIYHKSSGPAISEDLYVALVRFINAARQNSIDDSAIKEAMNYIYDKYEKYDDIPGLSTDTEKYRAMALWHDVLTKSQTERFVALGRHVEQHLTEILDLHVADQPYQHFMAAIQTIEATNPPIAVSASLLRDITANLPELMGGKGYPGWLDRTDREGNLISYLHLLRQRAKLREFDPRIMAQGSTKQFDDFIKVADDGQVYLNFEIRLDSPRKANGQLMYVSNLAECIRTQGNGFDKSRDASDKPKPAKLRAAEFFAASNDPQRKIGGGYRVLDPLGIVRPPSAPIVHVMMGQREADDINASAPTTISGFSLRTIHTKDPRRYIPGGSVASMNTQIR